MATVNCCSRPRKGLEEVNDGIFEVCHNCNAIGEQMFDYLYYEKKRNKPKEEESFAEWKHMWRDIGGEG